ncbi:YjhT family mutarotase [Vibrio sinensis]|uniref:YjhT family mutarotase n=1 Tax=Vibrio sinensis TaxID=2302434 RepID=A0A3A6QSM0_9VIBR|nr:YjhT family mutarotase [Vibrio sinensis]RJX75373.1 YjhT family mutarotase [Vibrio sinensis]
MSIQWRSLPDLPVGFKNGVGVTFGDTIYCGLGSLGQRWIALDVNDALATKELSPINGIGWQEKAPFPGCPRNDAVVISTSDGCYVFSGAGCEPEQIPQYPIVLTDGYFYNSKQDCWHKVCDDIPVGLLGGSGFQLTNGQLVFFGGYNKHKFDHLMHALNTEPLLSNSEMKSQCLVDFMSSAIEEYQWNQDIWSFTPETKQWHRIAQNPFLANCGAGAIVEGDKITLIEGEVKPGLRSRQVKQFSFDNSELKNTLELTSIHQTDHDHEGLAGAFCSAYHGEWFVAGGAYFRGSQANYKKGQWYSHQGLTKQYDKKVWQFDGSKWAHIGDMTIGRAYGVCVSTTSGVIIVGGERETGEALTECQLLVC